MHMIAGDLNSQLNIAAATLIKAAPGKLVTVSVVVAGTTAGSVNDSATIVGAAAANQIGALPNTVGVFTFWFPFFSGLVITPGTGQTLAVSWV